MANTMSKYGSNTNRPLSEIVGLSTDTKPTDSIEGIKIQNGSSFRELDTGKKFLFDAENTTWNEVSSGGGGGGGFNFITTPIATLDTNNTMYFYNMRLYTSESGVYDLAVGDSVDLYDHFFVLINPLVSISELSAIPGGAIIAFTPDDNFDLGSGVELSGDTITNGDGLGYVIRFWRTGTLTGTVYKIVDNHSQQIVWDDNVIIR